MFDEHLKAHKKYEVHLYFGVFLCDLVSLWDEILLTLERFPHQLWW